MSDESAGADVSQTRAESNAQPNTEQMVPQSKVNELVANAKLISAEKARKEAEAQYQQQLAQMQQQPQSIGGMQQQQQPDMQQQMSKLVEEKLAEKEQALIANQQRQQVDELARQYLEKMQQGETLYDDFKEVTGKYDPVKFPEVTLMAAQIDNTADVMYELNKNRMKLMYLSDLAKADPNLALDEMRKLSASIRRNEEAAQSTSRTPNPLSKLKTSIAGTDSGKKTIADYKRMFRA